MKGTKLFYANVNNFNFNELYQKSSLERKKKADRLSAVQDKKLSLLAGFLLDYALKSQGVIQYEIAYNEYGKPYLSDNSLFFNLSHSGDYCICTLSNKEVGCDVQVIKTVNLSLAKRYFAKSEFEYLANILDEKKLNNEFFRIWALKESYIKAVGKGLKLPLNSFEIPFLKGDNSLKINGEKYYIKEYDFLTEYKIAICSKTKTFLVPKEVK